MKYEKYYYKVHIEVWKHGENGRFGFINISHIPYKKLYEIFHHQIIKEEFLFEEVGGYQIDEPLYIKHKTFFDKEIPFKFDFSFFEYWIGLTGDDFNKYKKDYYEEWPPSI
ncbi:hypothetical protein [Pedobacter helvus]|uniref:Uncharacterized protein n=1 Tax=Pedobacter helvus TaxID=2563444 RepID=A0ABW9JJW9_9SPHI|nr:hypothetical protein [Pedobacter ureilyticus]